MLCLWVVRVVVCRGSGGDGVMCMGVDVCRGGGSAVYRGKGM